MSSHILLLSSHILLLVGKRSWVWVAQCLHMPEKMLRCWGTLLPHHFEHPRANSKIKVNEPFLRATLSVSSYSFFIIFQSVICIFGLGKLDCGQLIKEVLNAHTSARAAKEQSSPIMVMAQVIGERSPKREKAWLQPPIFPLRSQTTVHSLVTLNNCQDRLGVNN